MLFASLSHRPISLNVSVPVAPPVSMLVSSTRLTPLAARSFATLVPVAMFVPETVWPFFKPLVKAPAVRVTVFWPAVFAGEEAVPSTVAEVSYKPREYLGVEVSTIL